MDLELKRKLFRFLKSKEENLEDDKDRIEERIEKIERFLEKCSKNYEFFSNKFFLEQFFFIVCMPIQKYILKPIQKCRLKKAKQKLSEKKQQIIRIWKAREEIFQEETETVEEILEEEIDKMVRLTPSNLESENIPVWSSNPQIEELRELLEEIRKGENYGFGS